MSESKPVVVTFEKNDIALVRMRNGENRINNDFIRAFIECLDEIERAACLCCDQIKYLDKKCIPILSHRALLMRRYVFVSTCKGVVTTGEGKFYCNGLDTDWIATADSDVLANFFKQFLELLLRLLTFPIPTVAAINGHCFAGGALIALANDLRVMNSQRGWFCFNEVFISRRFGTFNMKLLQAKMNPAPTLHRAVVFGQRFTGPEAVSAGLVDKAVAPSMVLQESQRLLAVWIGKNGFLRESLQNMKLDVYADVVNELHPSKM